MKEEAKELKEKTEWAALLAEDHHHRSQLRTPTQREVKIIPTITTSRCTIVRHKDRLITVGHLRRFEKQGNKRATVLRDLDLYVLAFWRILWPKSTHAKFNAYMFNSQVARGELHPRFYTPSQLSKAEDRLGLSRKRGSTTAYQAMTPRNLARR